MGFPDAFAVPPPSDAHATGDWYRQIGNAVCPPVVQSIGINMLRALEGVVGGSNGGNVSTGKDTNSGNTKTACLYNPAGGALTGGGPACGESKGDHMKTLERDIPE